MSPDGSRLYVCIQRPNQIDVINLSSYAIIGSITVGFNPADVVISADGSTGWVANTGSSTVSRFSTTALAATAGIFVGSNPVGLALTPDGGRLFVANRGSNTVSVIDTASEQVISTVNVDRSPTGVVMGATPDGPVALIGCYDGGAISAIRLSNLSVSTPIRPPAPTNLAVSSDQARLYVCNNISREVYIYDLRTFALIARVNTGYPRPADIVIGVGELRAYTVASNRVVAINLGKVS